MSNRLVVGQLLHKGEYALKRPGTIVTLVRHANASTPSGGKDWGRRVSEKGYKQCTSMAQTFHAQAESAQIRMKSPLPRVSDTIVGLSYPPDEFDTVPELFVPYNETSRQNGVLDAAYQILTGNVGLSRIFEFPDVAEALDMATASSLCTLHDRLSKTSPTDGIISACLVGHGWFLPAMVYYLAGTHEVARRHVLYNPMGECEIIQVGVDQNGVPYWNRFPCPAV